MKFVIYCLKYNEKIGGSIVAHELSKQLVLLGEDVYTTSKPYFDGVKHFIEYKKQFSENEDYVTIYPEGLDPQNPLGSNYTVRWILYKPGYFNGYNGKYSNNEHVFQYGKSFTYNTPYENVPELTPIIPKLDIFYNKNKERIHDTCYLIKKGRHKLTELPTDGLILDNIEFDDEMLSEIFNTHKRFISYDSESYHSTQAALCGCLSIIIPDKNYNEITNNERPIGQEYGIAYGLSDIKHAISTQNLLKEKIEKEYSYGIQTVKDFRDYCLRTFSYSKESFSVVIPTMWKSKIILELLDNLNQSGYVSEIILIDNNPKEKKDITKFNKVMYYTSGYNLFVNQSFNIGVDMAKNELVCLCHDDVLFDVDNALNLIFKNRFGFNLIGLDELSITQINEHNSFKKYHQVNHNWGKLMFIKKSEYVEIPNALSIMYSAQWLSGVMKNIYSIILKGQIIIDNVSHVNDRGYQSIRNKDVAIWQSMKKL